MSRGTRTGRRRLVRAPRQPHRGIDLHLWQPSEVPGVCERCPLAQSNSVHDEAAIAAAQAARDEAQAEHQRRVGDR
jgi:hypothetical protein